MIFYGFLCVEAKPATHKVEVWMGRGVHKRRGGWGGGGEGKEASTS